MWKVVLHESPDGFPPIEIRQSVMHCGGGNTLIGYMIERIGDVIWEDIPDKYKEANAQGYRFVRIRPGLNLDHFEVVLPKM